MKWLFLFSLFVTSNVMALAMVIDDTKAAAEGGSSIINVLTGGVVVDQVVRVIDGDTYIVDVTAWPPLFGNDIRIRLRGIDTPELRTRCVESKRRAEKAKSFAANKLFAAKRIILTNLGRGSFFRVIANVEVDGKDLGKMIKEAGLLKRTPMNSVGRWETVEDGVSRIGRCFVPDISE